MLITDSLASKFRSLANFRKNAEVVMCMSLCVCTHTKMLTALLSRCCDAGNHFSSSSPNLLFFFSSFSFSFLFLSFLTNSNLISGYNSTNALLMMFLSLLSDGSSLFFVSVPSTVKSIAVKTWRFLYSLWSFFFSSFTEVYLRKKKSYI